MKLLKFYLCDTKIPKSSFLTDYRHFTFLIIIL